MSVSALLQNLRQRFQCKNVIRKITGQRKARTTDCVWAALLLAWQRTCWYAHGGQLYCANAEGVEHFACCLSLIHMHSAY
jgi:hypothetical protein